MPFFVKFITSLLILYSVYQLASLAGLFSEKSGVANIAIEGNMVLSAVVFLIMWGGMSNAIEQQELALIITIALSVPLCSTYMLLLSRLTNKYLANHIIVGTGMNLLAPVIGLFAYRWIENTNSNLITASFSRWIESSHGFQTLSVVFVVITLIILGISAFSLNKTRFGLRLRSSGENPYALETAGVSVSRTRTIALVIAGLLSSLAGIVFAVNDTFHFTVNGSGFIAIGILILGQYKILGIFIGSIIFATLISLFSNLAFLIKIGKWDNLLQIIPFVIPLIGLMVFGKHTAPKAVGKTFKKDQR